MTEKTRNARNLNPTSEAILAMIVHGERYAAQNGGSMDFWASLSMAERRQIYEWVKQIKAARTV